MIKNLVISGGSTKTIAVLGCLQYLEEQHLLAGITNYVGTSAGSLICMLLVLGYSSQDMIYLLRDHFFGNNLHHLTLDELMSLDFLQSYGMDTGNNIIIFLQDVLFLKFHVKDMTFVELAKATGKNLVVCGANITKEQSEHLSIDTFPNMSIVTALRISVSLPFIFTPVKFNDCYYVDGGIYESLPVSYIDKFTDPIKDTLAINTKTVNCGQPIKSFLDYIRVVFNTVVDKANAKTNVFSSKIKIIDIEFEDVDITSFSFENCSFTINDEIIKSHVDKGYAVIKQYFETQTSSDQ